MGTTNHNAIIATTYKDEEIERIKEWRKQHIEYRPYFIFGPRATNNYQTVVLVPDGSNEGWQESDAFDALRRDFVFQLEKGNFEDWSSPWSWIEVGFGEYGQKVLRGNCKNAFTDEEYFDPEDEE